MMDEMHGTAQRLRLVRLEKRRLKLQRISLRLQIRRTRLQACTDKPISYMYEMMDRINRVERIIAKFDDLIAVEECIAAAN